MDKDPQIENSLVESILCIAIVFALLFAVLWWSDKQERTEFTCPDVSHAPDYPRHDKETYYAPRSLSDVLI